MWIIILDFFIWCLRQLWSCVTVFKPMTKLLLDKGKPCDLTARQERIDKFISYAQPLCYHNLLQAFLILPGLLLHCNWWVPLKWLTLLNNQDSILPTLPPRTKPQTQSQIESTSQVDVTPELLLHVAKDRADQGVNIKS